MQLRFQEIASGKPFHAALVIQRGIYAEVNREKIVPHYHDFWELMYVLEGAGVHQLGEKTESEPSTLGVGTLLLIRPDDVHAVQASPGQALHFLNIAFLENPWVDFCAAARLSPQLAHWTGAPRPVSATLPVTERGACAAAFHGALRAFGDRPGYLDLCRLWSAVLPSFLQPLSEAETTPVWLRHACESMKKEGNLRIGLPRLNTLSGVSQAHLARTLKHYYGQTPTEFVNELRLKRAATLLTTTTGAISDVAADCGFNNLSYFYRCFHRRFGYPPRAFRLAASKQVVPKAQP